MYVYIYIMCVCVFQMSWYFKAFVAPSWTSGTKKNWFKTLISPYFLVRRGLWILSCRFSSGSVQNEISVVMFFVVPSVTLLSLNIHIYTYIYIYIYMWKKNSHSSKSCSVSRVSWWIFHINRAKFAAGWTPMLLVESCWITLFDWKKPPGCLLMVS